MREIQGVCVAIMVLAICCLAAYLKFPSSGSVVQYSLIPWAIPSAISGLCFVVLRRRSRRSIGEFMLMPVLVLLMCAVFLFVVFDYTFNYPMVGYIMTCISIQLASLILSGVCLTIGGKFYNPRY